MKSGGLQSPGPANANAPPYLDSFRRNVVRFKNNLLDERVNINRPALGSRADDRILPVDRAVAEEWGRMNVPDPLPVIDGLLAATAKIHGLSFATRNTKDIARSGVSCLNPFVEP